MTRKTEVAPQKEEAGPETPPDIPLFDLADAAIKKLIHNAKERGYVTHDQINLGLRSEEVNSEQIEDILTLFSEMGISVLDTEEKEGAREAPEEESANELVEVQQKLPAKAEKKDPTDRTDVFKARSEPRRY